jgi:hypothetical protein
MSLIDNQPAFCQIAEMSQDGEPLMVQEIMKVPNNELQLTEDENPPDAEAATADIVPRKPQAFLSLTTLEERDDAVFNNPLTYSAYNELHSKLKQERHVELKNVQKNKQVEVAAKSAATKGKSKLQPAKGLKEMKGEKKRKKGIEP